MQTLWITRGIKMESKKPKDKSVKRIIKGMEDVHHDLFRLESSNTKKNISFNKNSPIWEPVAHKHFYHTVDSDGKPQDKCGPTAGHFHFVTVEERNGELVAKCSEPYVMGRDKNTKKMAAVPYENDKHTHDVTYLQSEVLKRRVMNADALKEISRMESENAARMANPL